MLSLSKKKKTVLDGLVENSLNHDQSLEKQTSKNQKESLSTFSFFWMQLVSFIPIINLVPLLFWSFNSKVNENKKSFARSNLIWTAVFIFLILFLFLTFVFLNCPLDFSFWLKKLEKVLINKLKK